MQVKVSEEVESVHPSRAPGHFGRFISESEHLAQRGKKEV